ncbi:MAG: dihydrofolate reductase [Rikenellaceae bacterium]
MIISIIVATAHNSVIGKDNNLIWHISEDLRYFKATTSGHTVIMGRKSYESIGRPLPNRRNIIITRNSDFSAPGCEVVNSIEHAIELSNDGNSEEVFIIGGGEIYRQSIDKADKLYITHVDNNYEGDTYFPGIKMSEWKKVSSEKHIRGEKFEYPFEFAIYERA